MYYVYARRRDDSSPCGFEKLETQYWNEAFSRAREWHAEGYIVRVFYRNEHGLFAAVPLERGSGSNLTQSIALEIVALLEKKHADYGPVERTLGRFGLKGVVVRISDKTERLINLVWHQREPKNETVEDTLRDLVGYGLLALAMLRQEKPEQEG